MKSARLLQSLVHGFVNCTRISEAKILLKSDIKYFSHSCFFGQKRDEKSLVFRGVFLVKCARLLQSLVHGFVDCTKISEARILLKSDVKYFSHSCFFWAKKG